jgi:peptidoglycan/xylan/chitin deacetylase (PgdA/CDA1 family)
MLLIIDVEDGFQVENLKSAFPFESWPACELRVERNTHKLLDLFDSINVQPATGNLRTKNSLKATFFVLGWIAERLPNLVREIKARGHEVASHGFCHELCSQCSVGHPFCFVP